LHGNLVLGPPPLKVRSRGADDHVLDVNLTGFEDEELTRVLATQEVAAGLTDEESLPELLEMPICAAA
jgi:hypothetical protein